MSLKEIRKKGKKESEKARKKERKEREEKILSGIFIYLNKKIYIFRY